MGPAVKIRLRDGTGTRDYKFVTEDADRHGNVRIYFRRKGQRKIRLTQTPGTPAFDQEYQRAFRADSSPAPRQEGRAVVAPGSMRWLCEQYFSSAAFQALGESTRKVRRGLLDTICERAGSYRFSAMEPHHVAKLRDEKASFPEAANARVKALRQLFAWATSPEYRYTDKNIDATPTGHLVYLLTAFGRPYSVKAFGNWFKRRCREAGVDDDLSAHGLRKLSAQRCVEAGATEHQIMALFGWASTKQAAIYTRKANRARLEGEAAVLLHGPRGNESVPLFPMVASGGTIRRKKR
jgi:hypothetical protein